jgi:hypothetical protein
MFRILNLIFKFQIACLFVLVLATQFQFYKCGLSAVDGGNVVNDGFSEVHVTNTVPVANPVAQARDELGQASFGYAHPGQAATNLRDGFGNQIGSYAYINPEGKEVRVSYTADSRGFRVLSNDLRVAPVANLVAPVQVEDTPEVAKAKADHAVAVTAAKSGVAPVAPVVALPSPVQDTPEVAAAKAEFAVKFAAAKDAVTPAVRAKRQVFGFGATPFGYPAGYSVSPYAYTVAAPAMPVREATLTKTILTPGHAVAYRVD